MGTGIETTQNLERNRFELKVQDGLAVIEYTEKKSTNQIFLVHTEVPEALRGNGWGEKLVKESLDIIRSSGKKVVPLCPFVRAYLKRHPEYHDIIDESKKDLFI